MGAKVNVNMMTVVHQSSNGIVTFMPDVCLTPAPPGPPVPIPYPNIAQSTDTAMGSTTVKMDKKPIMLKGSVFKQSTGDEAGSVGGVVSGVVKGKAEFINFSFNVKVEGKPVPRLGDLMLGNKGGTFNTPPMAEIQPPIVCVVPEQSESSDSLEVNVTDGTGKPLKDAEYKLKKPDGTKKEGKTDGSGKIKVDDTVAGAGQLIVTGPE